MSPATYLDAVALRRGMVVYHDLLVQHRRRLNSLNVYPVPDADTGTNMAMTMQSVLDALDGSTGSDLGAVIARGALLGARGASGVILSQLLGTMARCVAADPECGGACLAGALRESVAAGYAAVAHPVEGTILTVARAAAEAAEAAAFEDPRLAAVLAAAHSGAGDTLERTPDLLPALRAAGVVDAGGAGYLLLLDAMLHVVSGVPVPGPTDVGPPPMPESEAAARGRYEVVVHIAGDSGALDGFRSAWEDLGSESTVVVEGETRWVAHLHTDDLQAALAAAEASGRVLDTQVTDLLAQIAELGVRGSAEARTALVAVADGDGLRELFRRRGATILVAGGPARNPSTAELLDAVERAGAHDVILLPNDHTVVPAATQVIPLSRARVAVVPTRSVFEGLAAAAAFDGSRDLPANVDALTAAAGGVRSGGITRAVRDADSEVGPIRRGDWLALTPGGPLIIAGTPLDAARQLLEALVAPGSLRATVLVGGGADEEVPAALEDWAAQRWPALELRVESGGQPLYPYLVGVEVSQPSQ